MKLTIGKLLDHQERESIARRIVELKQDFEIIKNIKNNVTAESLHETMKNLQDYTILKNRFLAVLNQLQLDSLKVMNSLQYSKLREIVRKFQQEL